MKIVKYPLLTLTSLVCICVATLSQDLKSKHTVEELLIKSQRAIETQPDSIAIYAAHGLELAQKNGDLRFVTDFKKYLGIHAYLQGNSESAIEYLTAALESNKLLSRPSEQAICATDLGMVYSKLGDYIKAIGLHLEAIALSKAGNNEEITATIHNNLGLTYKDNGKLEDALLEYKAAIELFKVTNSEEKLAGCLVNAGNLELIRGEYLRSLQYFREALGIFETNKHSRGQSIAFNSIADALFALGKYIESREFRNRALTLSSSRGFKASEILALAGAGELSAMEGNYEESLGHYTKGIHLARRINSTKELLRLYKGASDSYDKLGNSVAALQFYRQYTALKDSLFRIDTDAYLANLRVLAEVSKKETEILSLKKDSRIANMSRNMTFIVSAALLAVLGLSVFGLRQKRKGDRAEFDKQVMIHRANEEKIQTELKVQKEREDELTRELDFRSRTLTTYTLNLVQKNGMMEEIKTGLQEVMKKGTSHEHELKKLVRLVDYSYSLDKDWEGFKTYFEQVHPEFFKKIKEDYPQISTTELRLCALIRLSLSIKEAATILNIAPDSVKVARHRIRKKLNLPSDASISDFIMSI